jgi:hypothetical protein
MLARAARSQRPEEAEAALEAAAQFTEVLRRGALALKRYRGAAGGGPAEKALQEDEALLRAYEERERAAHAKPDA